MNILSLPLKPPTDPIDPFIGRVIYEAFPSRFGRDGLKYHLAAGGQGDDRLPLVAKSERGTASKVALCD